MSANPHYSYNVGLPTKTAWEEMNTLLSQVSPEVVQSIVNNDKFSYSQGTITNRFIQYLMTTEYGQSFFRIDSQSRYMAEDMLKSCQELVHQIPLQNAQELERLRQENSMLMKKLSEQKPEVSNDTSAK